MEPVSIRARAGGLRGSLARQSSAAVLTNEPKNSNNRIAFTHISETRTHVREMRRVQIESRTLISVR